MAKRSRIGLKCASNCDAPIAQLAEAADLKSAQCRFESDWGHRDPAGRCAFGLGSQPCEPVSVSRVVHNTSETACRSLERVVLAMGIGRALVDEQARHGDTTKLSGPPARRDLPVQLTLTHAEASSN
jgi:hypothetical protein